MQINNTSLVQNGSATARLGLSGQNFTALIQQQYQLDLRPANTLQTQNSQEQQRITQLQSMSTLLGNLQKSINQLASVSSPLSTFGATTATLTSSGAANTANALKVTTTNSSPAGTYNLKILQRASAHRITSAAQSSDSAALNKAGVFSLNVEGRTAKNITITNGMSLKDVATQINKETADTGVSASIVRVSASEFRLVLSAVGTNKKIQFSQISGANIPQSTGLTNAGGAIANELSAARPAKMQLNGLAVTRDSNRITDLIQGTTLDLLKTTGSDTITVKIGTDTAKIQKAIQNFVNEYNKYRQFALKQQAVAANGSVSANARLFGSSILKNVNTKLYSQLTSIIKIGGKDYSLRQFGITFEKDNTLKLDGTKLSNALKTDLGAVKSFFAFSTTSSNPNFRITKHAGSYAAQNLNVAVTTNGSGQITAATVNGNSSDFTVSGKTIKGKAGTAREGLEITFVGNSSQTGTLTLSQGIADRMVNDLKRWTDSGTGLLAEEVSKANAVIKKRTQEMTDIRTRASLRRQQLIQRYAAIEQQIARSNLLLRQMQAIQAAANARTQ